jgi:NAD(P)-dependent dehydrogenase (short-subunit alcohol dehydrogenase family)
MAARERRLKSKRSVTPGRGPLRPTSSPSLSGRLSGKSAVVTGGNRGIGLAIARTLVAEGCNILITGRNRAALKDAKTELDAVAAHLKPRPEVVAERCEVRKPDSVDAVFALVKKSWGRLDVLVNNAGVSQPMISVEKTPLETWNEVIETNLTGFFLCTRAALPLMARGSMIINNLSVAAKQIFINFAAYNASKHGGLGLTLTLREELIPKGIRVMALMPGPTDTAIWEQFWPDAPRNRMLSADSVAQAVLTAVLLPPDANLSELVLVPMKGAL